NFKVFRKVTEVSPSFLAGHSLGEFSALVCAKAISFSDALKLVRKRGELMSKASHGGMAAVMGLEESKIKDACRKISSDDSFVVVSNNNAPDQIVISGHKAAVSKAEEVLSGLGGKVKILNVSAAFHSPLMKEAAEEFKSILTAISFNIPSWPVVSNVTGRPLTDAVALKDELFEQLISPVQWQLSMNFMKENNIDTFIDIGPGQVVKNLAVKNIPDAKVYAFDKASDLEELKDKFAVNPYKPKITFLAKSMAIAVCAKNNNWDNNEYDIGVTKPYIEIQNLNSKLEEEGNEPDKEHMLKALDMLQSVFRTKKTAVSEQIERFTQLFDETDTWSMFPEFKMPEN
ncbi:MAG: ACP S-malonyltransferase, partial [Bacillota bacterium]|nr:ACP S-malonyltransferase [Bacillota bacterium]